MSEKTVMEIADDIMSNMGITSESVKPLSEATEDSLHSVGKTYDLDLPELTDEQRQSLIEGSVGGKVSIPTKSVDADADGDEEDTANTVKAKIEFDKSGQGTIQAINKVNAPRTNAKRAKKLRRSAKKTTEVSNVEEMTSVGSIGMSWGAPEADPYKGRKSNWEPATKKSPQDDTKKKKLRNEITSDFITKTFNKAKKR